MTAQRQEPAPRTHPMAQSPRLDYNVYGYVMAAGEIISRKELHTRMLELLKRFNAEAMTLEDMVELSTGARAVVAEFETLGVDLPEWITAQVESLRNTIAGRVADAKAKKIRELKAELNKLKTAEEKRLEIAAKLAALEAQ